MDVEMVVMDSFTDVAFGGNPAAVMVLDEWLPESMMQSIATENNLSETAFLVHVEGHRYDIRWFSPMVEVDFCGHATLAAASVVFDRVPSLEFIEFTTKYVDDLSAKKLVDGRVELDFPNTKATKVKSVPSALVRGLSIRPVEVYENTQAYIVVYESEADVLAVESDSQLLKELAPRDVAVTALSDNDMIDFVSRYFWPANGGDEDPVTGSIHTALAPLWAERLSKDSLVAYQASTRGGILYCDVRGDRVLISGHAVIYSKGTVLLDRQAVEGECL